MSWTWLEALNRFRQAVLASLTQCRPAATLIGSVVLSSASALGAEYRVESLIPHSPVHGVNGMEFDHAGRLIVSSMAGAEIYRIDVATGKTETLVGPPAGLGDGLAIAPDGTIAWTALPAGEVRALRPDGEIAVLATDLPGINSINFNGAGRLYAAQVRAGDGLYEIDVNGEQPPALVARGMDCPTDELCGLNSFDISADNILYGPLMAGGVVVRIDLDTGAVSEVAEGFDRPTGVRLDSKGNLYVLNWLTGTLIRVDRQTSEQELIAELPPPLDNLTIGPDGLVYVSNPVHNIIYRVNPDTGAVAELIKGGLVMPGGLALTEENGRELLLVSGVFGHSRVDAETGTIQRHMEIEALQASFAIDVNAMAIAISDYRSGTVKVLDRGSGREQQVLTGFQQPYDVKLLADGSLLLAEFGAGALLRIGPEQSRRVLAGDLKGPLGLAISDNDSVYVTERAGGTISRIGLEDGTRAQIVAGLAQPEGIAINPDGALVVAEVGARQLTLVDPGSGATQVLAEDLPIGALPYTGTDSSGPPPAFLPTGVAVGQGGEIFVVSDRDHTVLKVSPP